MVIATYVSVMHMYVLHCTDKAKIIPQHLCSDKVKSSSLPDMFELHNMQQDTKKKPHN